MNRKSIKCDLCGAAAAQLRRISRSFGRGSTLLVVECVPVVTCAKCGETYLTAETLHELERIKQHRRELARKRSVAVATFA
jgi:YgiT-type zinc finger domain-containing protein